jgi:hypothetical protein
LRPSRELLHIIIISMPGITFVKVVTLNAAYVAVVVEWKVVTRNAAFAAAVGFLGGSG